MNAPSLLTCKSVPKIRADNLNHFVVEQITHSLVTTNLLYCNTLFKLNARVVIPLLYTHILLCFFKLVWYNLGMEKTATRQCLKNRYDFIICNQ